MQTILVVEDDPQIAEIERDYLRRAGFDVVTAASGEEALAIAGTRTLQLIVLDVRLPDINGIDVARTLRRRRSDVPIIMLTARVDEADRLTGLDAGADDYVTKPFSPRELVARVRAVLRRTSRAGSDVLTIGDLSLDVPRMVVTRDGESLDLTPTEFELLATMARHPGRVFTRTQLLDAIRGDDVDSFDRAIDAHVKNVRRKIERDVRRPRYVLTVYGVGYKCADT